MNIHERTYLTVAEATAIASIGRTKFFELLAKGEIEGIKLGRRTLVKASSLRDFMDHLPRVGQSR